MPSLRIHVGQIHIVVVVVVAVVVVVVVGIVVVIGTDFVGSVVAEFLESHFLVVGELPWNVLLCIEVGIVQESFVVFSVRYRVESCW